MYQYPIPCEAEAYAQKELGTAHSEKILDKVCTGTVVLFQPHVPWGPLFQSHLLIRQASRAPAPERRRRPVQSGALDDLHWLPGCTLW